MVNINEIKDQFRKVITFSQGIENPQIDVIFKNWYKAKKKYIEAFGGCIYESPETVTFTLDEKAKEEKVLNLIDYIGNNNADLADFIYYNKSDFFKNKLTKEYKLSDGQIIPANIKLIKAFKYFEKDEKLLHQIQDRASQIIQENTVNGKLCFSVHPLDYLSSSLNNYNWRSCHALDGEYRTGNLSYMQDYCTVICYLKGEDNVNIPLFPEDVKWNSKKWRMLVFFSEDGTTSFCGRPYPFMTETGVKLTLTTLIKALNWESKYNSIWRNESEISNYYLNHIKDDRLGPYAYYLSSKYVYSMGQLIKIEDVISDEKYSLHFNDLLYSTCYFPYYRFGDRDTNMPSPIVIGHSTPCLQCGAELIAEGFTMRCNECELKYGTETKFEYGYCECCGQRIYLEDAYLVNDDGVDVFVCEHCKDLETEYCAKCGDRYFRSDMYYDREISDYICFGCKEEQ